MTVSAQHVELRVAAYYSSAVISETELVREKEREHSFVEAPDNIGKPSILGWSKNERQIFQQKPTRLPLRVR